MREAMPVSHKSKPERQTLLPLPFCNPGEVRHDADPTPFPSLPTPASGRPADCVCGLFVGAASPASSIHVVAAVVEVSGTSTCRNGVVVQDADANPGLVGDCMILLAAGDVLRDSAALDWSRSRLEVRPERGPANSQVVALPDDLPFERVGIANWLMPVY